MNKAEYESLLVAEDHELFDHVTEPDGSQRKWVAIYILEHRRNQRLLAAAKSSAKAAWIAAFVAGISAIAAVIAVQPF